jgi:hypothetical protein
MSEQRSAQSLQVQDTVQDGTVQFKSDSKCEPVCVSLVGLIDNRREKEGLNASQIRDYEIHRMMISGSCAGSARLIVWHGSKEEFCAASVPSDFSLMTTSLIIKDQKDLIYDSQHHEGKWCLQLEGCKLKSKVQVQTEASAVIGDVLVIILFDSSTFEGESRRPFCEFNYMVWYICGWSPVKRLQGKQVHLLTPSGPTDGRDKGRVVSQGKASFPLSRPSLQMPRFSGGGGGMKKKAKRKKKAFLGKSTKKKLQELQRMKKVVAAASAKRKPIAKKKKVSIGSKKRFPSVKRVFAQKKKSAGKKRASKQSRAGGDFRGHKWRF